MIIKALKRVRRHFVVHLIMPIFNNFGWRFYLSHRPDFSDRLDRNAMKRITKLWEHGQRGNNRGDWTRLYFLIASIKNLQGQNIQGAVAELGVFKGASAKIFNILMPERDLYLFDTFEGFSERDTAKDPSGAKAGHYNGSLDEVKNFVGTAPNIHYCKGVFPDTAAMVQDDATFALVHLDCDLYEPMKAACEFFYDRLEPRGMLIIHDYHSGCWPGVQQAVDGYFADKPEKPVLIPDKSGSAVLVKNAILQQKNRKAAAINLLWPFSIEALEGSYAMAAFAFI